MPMFEKVNSGLGVYKWVVSAEPWPLAMRSRDLTSANVAVLSKPVAAPELNASYSWARLSSPLAFSVFSASGTGKVRALRKP